MDNVKRFVFCVLLLVAVFPCQCADIKTVSGEYTFVGDGTQSPVECRRLALEGAKLQALAREFGTIVSQDIFQRETAGSKSDDTYFSSMSSTEVKGEWIADDGDPVYETFFDADGNIVVKCRIRGKARAISNESVDFAASILRNGKEAKNADTSFRAGDDMYLSFLSPVDGYVAAFLVGEDMEVYRLLPYGSDNSGQVKVKHGKPYLFFDAASEETPGRQVDEYRLTASSPVERNSIYVIFSPAPFSLRADSQVNSELPPRQTFREFSKWLSDSRRHDAKMGVRVMHIEITQ